MTNNIVDMSQLITVKVAAKAVAKDPETIRRWIHENKLDARKIGQDWFIAKADLAAYVGKDLFEEEEK